MCGSKYEAMSKKGYCTVLLCERKDQIWLCVSELRTCSSEEARASEDALKLQWSTASCILWNRISLLIDLSKKFKLVKSCTTSPVRETKMHR